MIGRYCNPDTTHDSRHDRNPVLFDGLILILAYIVETISIILYTSAKYSGLTDRLSLVLCGLKDYGR